MGVKLYFSTVSGNLKISKQQQRITMILDSKSINYEVIDIAASEDDKQKMRSLSGNPKALAPQIFNDDQYCGDFEAFDAAVEADDLDGFLKRQ